MMSLTYLGILSFPSEVVLCVVLRVNILACKHLGFSSQFLGSVQVEKALQGHVC
jgi:hypothetical protein